MKHLLLSTFVLQENIIMLTVNLWYSTTRVWSKRKVNLGNASNFTNYSSSGFILQSELEKGDISIFSASIAPIHKGQLSTMSGIFIDQGTIFS